MIFTQLTHLPIIFQADENIIGQVDYFLRRNKLSFNSVLVASGGTISKRIADRVDHSGKWERHTIQENTNKEVDKLKRVCTDRNIDLIIAVGGGKVLDVVKRVSYLININHLSVPTIISNDGLISPISVIKNDLDRTESIPGAMPMGVIIDLEIIKNAPSKFLVAAAGDILSNLSATNDWILSHNATGEYINDIAFYLARNAANTLVYFETKEISYKPFMRQVIQGQMNSGIAMSLAGSSRPCSGSEHLISHAIDYLKLSKDILHGAQVASSSIFALFLQEKLNDSEINYARQTDIPLVFTDLLKEPDDKSLLELFKVAKQMRPGRFTVLNTMTPDHFLSKYNSFLEEINSLSDQ